ncbi:hypothetical protein CR513_60504, partial [Mucuna pruriens]
MVHYKANQSIFFRHSSLNELIHLLMYIDDIIIIGHEKRQERKSIIILMDPNVKLLPNQGEAYPNLREYKRLISLTLLAKVINGKLFESFNTLKGHLKRDLFILIKGILILLDTQMQIRILIHGSRHTLMAEEFTSRVTILHS